MATSGSPQAPSPPPPPTAGAAGGIRRSTRVRRQVQSIYDDAIISMAEQAIVIAESVSQGKRKKRTKRVSPMTLPIYNLPESVLLHITSFMKDTSKVLLAVALSASSDKIRKSNYDIRPCSIGRSILGSLRYIPGSKSYVNFETDKDLAARLSDEDVGGMLSCLNVKELVDVNLTNLVNITGKCLVSLCDSADELRTLDLSLVSDEVKGSDDQPESKLSKIDVIPILDRLLDSEKCAKPNIIFPKKWRKEGSQLLGRFIAKYNLVMREREVVCDCCEKNFCGTAEKSWICKTVGETFGTYNLTCFSCKINFCDDCAEEHLQELCQKCDQRYCIYCCSGTMCCDLCGETTCWSCTEIDTCEECNKTTCTRCLPVPYRECCYRWRCIDCCPRVYCDHPDCDFRWSNCDDCSDENHECIKWCRVCNVSYCGEHLLKRCYDKGSDDLCSGCEARALLNLAADNEVFGTWVQELEDRYSVKGRDCWTYASSDLSQAMDAREELRKRCHAVGELLLPKQKKFENYESRFEGYDSLSKW